MRPALVTAGVLLLVLGGTLIAIGPVMMQAGFYRLEAQAISQTSPTGSNVRSILASELTYVNEGQAAALVGAVLAPIGAAILAYGLITGGSRMKAEEPVPVAEPSHQRDNPPF